MFLFFFKNWFKGTFASSSRLRASREICLREIKNHIFIQKLSLLFREYFVTNLFSRNGFLAKTDFFSKSHRNFRDCLAPNSRLTASRESIFALVALFSIVSRLIHYCLTREKCMFSVFM